MVVLTDDVVVVEVIFLLQLAQSVRRDNFSRSISLKKTLIEQLFASCTYLPLHRVLCVMNLHCIGSDKAMHNQLSNKSLVQVRT